MAEKSRRGGQKGRPFFLHLPRFHKRWIFRFSTILLTLLPLFLIEAALRISSPKWLEPNFDPFIGFSSNQPLFELNPENARFRIRKNQLRSFAQNTFSYKKSRDTFRIFCLGGSTVQGRPYSVETSFTSWLRLALETQNPGRKFEVINCGGVSYASYRLVPVLRECLNQYDPDLILICTGNNEFLEDRSYRFTKKIAASLDPFLDLARTSRLIQSVISLANHNRSADTPHTTLDGQVNAMLDYERGIERYHRNEAWQTSVEDHFRLNIHRMLRICSDRRVPVMLVSPCFNLKDSPPFKSESSTTLNKEVSHKWKSHLKAASDYMKDDLNKAIAQLQKALSIDKGYAATWYALGQAYLQKSHFQKAKQCFQQALELDVCPLRINTALRTTLRDAAANWSVPFYDLQELAAEDSALGIAGYEFLIDHVHPTIRGHQRIGIELAGRIQSHWLEPNPKLNLEQEVEKVFSEHLSSIPSVYYLIGMERLKGLKAWTQGRAEGSPIENHPDVTDGI